MSESLGKITLVTGTYQIENKETKCLVAAFKPPLPKDIPYREVGDGHPELKVITDEMGDTKAVVYCRGVFGWNESEREEDFVRHWQHRAEKLGYEVPSPAVHRIGKQSISSQVKISQ